VGEAPLKAFEAVAARRSRVRGAADGR